METPRVAFALLTKSSATFQTWTGDASDLGWAPGYWPETIVMVGDSGDQTEFDCVKVELDGTHVYRALTGSVTVRIFND